MIHDISSYLYLAIYVLLWVIVCYRHYKKVKFSSGLVVILSYLIYGILALILYSDEYLGNNFTDLKLFPFIYLFGMSYMFLLPVFKYERADIVRVSIPSRKIVLLFLIIYSFCTLIILPNTISSLQEGITTLLLDESGGIDLYQDASGSYVKRASGVSGLYGLVSIIYNIFSDIAKFLFFYYLTLKNKNKFLIIIFCVVFIVDLIYPMSKGGRTDVIMNLYSLIMAGTLFYPFYSEKMKKRLSKSLILLLVIVSIPFMALTISRFGETESGTSGGMLSYAGQAPLNFNMYALDAGGIRNGDRTINLFKQFIFNDVPEDVIEVRLKYSHLKMNDSVFSSYVGDFVLDYGPLGAFLIFVFASVLLYNKIRICNKTISFQSLFIIYFILCVAMQGGMYLFYYSFMGNLTILAFLFMSLILYIDSSVRYKKDYIHKLK